MRLLTRIRTLARVRPGAEPAAAGGRSVGRDHPRRQRPLGEAAAVADSRRSPRRCAHGASHRRGVDRHRDPRPRRVRVLDRELVALRGGGRRADGDLRGDDRARAARSCRAGSARSLHRPSRPRARGVAWPHGCDGGPHGAEHPHQPLGRLRLRRPCRARRGCAAPRRERRRARGHRRERLRGEPVRARPARPGSADPDERRAAHLELPALAGCVLGARVRRQAVAGLRRDATFGTRSRSTHRAVAASAAAREQLALADHRRDHRCAGRARGRLSRRLVGVRARADRGADRAARVLAARTAARAARARPVTSALSSRSSAPRWAASGGRRRPVHDLRCSPSC